MDPRIASQQRWIMKSIQSSQNAETPVPKKKKATTVKKQKKTSTPTTPVTPRTPLSSVRSPPIGSPSPATPLSSNLKQQSVLSFFVKNKPN